MRVAFYTLGIVMVLLFVSQSLNVIIKSGFFSLQYSCFHSFSFCLLFTASCNYSSLSKDGEYYYNNFLQLSIWINSTINNHQTNFINIYKLNLTIYDGEKSKTNVYSWYAEFNRDHDLLSTGNEFWTGYFTRKYWYYGWTNLVRSSLWASFHCEIRLYHPWVSH